MLLRWLRGSYGSYAQWARVAWWAALPTLGGALEAAGDALALSERSPFLPPGFTPPAERSSLADRRATAREERNLPEFRGVYSIGEDYRFLLRVAGEQNGAWVGLRDDEADFFVHAFDPATNEIELDFNGQRKTVELASLASNTTPLPVSGQTVAANRPNRVYPARPGASNAPVRRRLVPPAPPDFVPSRAGQGALASRPVAPPGRNRGNRAMAAGNTSGDQPAPFAAPGPQPSFVPELPPGGLPDPPSLPPGVDLSKPPAFPPELLNPTGSTTDG